MSDNNDLNNINNTIDQKENNDDECNISCVPNNNDHIRNVNNTEKSVSNKSKYSKNNSINSKKRKGTEFESCDKVSSYRYNYKTKEYDNNNKYNYYRHNSSISNHKNMKEGDEIIKADGKQNINTLRVHFIIKNLYMPNDMRHESELEKFIMNVFYKKYDMPLKYCKANIEQNAYINNRNYNSSSNYHYVCKIGFKYVTDAVKLYDKEIYIDYKFFPFKLTNFYNFDASATFKGYINDHKERMRNKPKITIPNLRRKVLSSNNRNTNNEESNYYRSSSRSKRYNYKHSAISSINYRNENDNYNQNYYRKSRSINSKNSNRSNNSTNNNYQCYKRTSYIRSRSKSKSLRFNSSNENKDKRDRNYDNQVFSNTDYSKNNYNDKSSYNFLKKKKSKYCNSNISKSRSKSRSKSKSKQSCEYYSKKDSFDYFVNNKNNNKGNFINKSNLSPTKKELIKEIKTNKDKYIDCNILKNINENKIKEAQINKEEKNSCYVFGLSETMTIDDLNHYFTKKSVLNPIKQELIEKIDDGFNCNYYRLVFNSYNCVEKLIDQGVELSNNPLLILPILESVSVSYN